MSEPLKGPRWACIKCGTEVGGSNLTRTVFDEYRGGYCAVCSKGDSLFRIVPDPDVARAEGERAVLAAVEAGSDAEWKIAAVARLRELVASGVEFTADDVTRKVGLPARRNAVGALLSGLARSGGIETVGYRHGERSSQHSRTVRVWRSR